MLLILPFESAPLGRMMTRLSRVVSLVLTILTSVTMPVNPCASMTSPALKGLNIKSIMPPAKFWTVPPRATPIAIPPAARSAASDVVFTPSALMARMMTSTQRVIVSSDSVKEVRAASRFFFCIPLRTLLRTILMIHAPTM